MIRNNQGFTLIETMVTLSIMAVAAIGFMIYSQNNLKSEARMKVRQSLNQLESQTLEYLKNTDVCNANIGEAFKNVRFDSSELEGNPVEAILSSGTRDSFNPETRKVIVQTGDIYDGGRILVSGIRYLVTDLAEINLPNSPWTHSGKVSIEVEFQTCQTGGAVAREEPSPDFGPKGFSVVCPPTSIKSSLKKFNKYAAFKIKDGVLEQMDVKRQVQNDGVVSWEKVGERPNIQCADSQDALANAMKDYTDRKICLLDARMMAFQGREGQTACGYQVSIHSAPVKEVTGGTMNISIPNSALNGSLVAKLIGGGGGGAGGRKHEGGTGGKAGILVEKIISNSVIGKSCTLIAAMATSNVGQRTDGKKGSPSRITCTGIGDVVVVEGGAGGVGRSDGHNNGGGGEASPFGAGGAGGSYKAGGGCGRGSGKNAVGPGAGGGGGTSNGNGCGGGRGGPGKVILSWKEVKITGPEGENIDLNTMAFDNEY